MGDLFDEFKKELERRRAELESQPREGSWTGGRDARARGDDDDGESADAEPLAHDAGDDDSDPGAPTPIRRQRTPAGNRESIGGARHGGADRPPRDGTGTHGGGNGPRGPRDRNGRPVGGANDGEEPPSWRTFLGRAGLVIAGVIVLAVIFLAGSAIDLLTDATWFKSVGFDSVFWTRLSAQVGLFAAAAVVAFLVIGGNAWLAGRLTPPVDPERPGRLREATDRWSDQQREAERRARISFGVGGGAFPGQGGPGADAQTAFTMDDIPDLAPLVTWILAGVALFIALGIGGSVSGSWETVALYLNRVPFSPTGVVVDPVFGKDVSFFLFELPFLRGAQGLVSGLAFASLIVAGGRYLVNATRGEVFVTRVRVHLAILGGIILLTIAFGHQLDKYELVYSNAGVATGVSYTDANARFLANDVLMVLSGIAAALLVGGAFTRWVWPLGAVVILWMSASFVMGGLYPEAIQRLTVDPNTFAQEERYIANNIAMTRLGFGIDDWESRDYQGTAPLSAAAVQAEADTFSNARLWDYRPLQKTLDQLQTVRQYYDFVDVDTDRYEIGGQIRQVMLSGRELAIGKNTQATSWVNQRIIYTHGVGIAMVPVNEVTPEGQPRLWIKDLPPASSEGAPEIKEPRIYFGEADSHYVVVRARQAEFDYPAKESSGAADETTKWTGTTGIPLDTMGAKLLFALRFGDLDLLISDQVMADSQLLMHRTLAERLQLIAPFLRYDKDPYLVIDERGHLVYVQDAYTLTNAFPNASSFYGSDLGETSGLWGERFNYLRNSVKVTMDAYDGTMTFYVADAADPLIRAWSGVFPALFRPMADMPSGVASHLRVPEELFNVQTRIYGRYHVTAPLAFFNNNDRWAVPEGKTNEQSLPSEAYYVVMRMPGEKAAEFLLLQPMVAASRPNMISWVAARNDGADYGKVVAYQFPSDTTIFGPAQIEGRIDQDPTISAQISLWNQSGSSVIRGNLIVVPVGDSLLYLQPVYLQSTSAQIPEFRKIVVASPTTVVWGDSLAEALNALLAKQGAGGGSVPTPTPGPGESPAPSTSPSPSSSPDASATPVPSATPTPPDDLPLDVNGLVAYANTHFELAQTALRNGDFATYGAEMDKVAAALARLEELTASPTPNP